MNPGKYIHTVSVKRGSTGATVTAPTTVISSLACLIEPLPAKLLDSIMGRVPNACYTMTWGTADVRMNDTIVFSGHEYIIKEIRQDTLRPERVYQVGILTRVAGR